MSLYCANWLCIYCKKVSDVVEKRAKKEFSRLIEDIKNSEKSEEKNVKRKMYVEAVLGGKVKPQNESFSDEIPSTKVISSTSKP